MLRSGGESLVAARRAVAASVQRPPLHRSFQVNGRLRLARHRRLSTVPPPGGKKPQPPVVAEEAGAKAVAEGTAPPLPEVPVLEAPAGACGLE